MLALAFLPAAVVVPGATDDSLAAIELCGITATGFGVFAACVPTLRFRFGLAWLLRLRNPAAGIAFLYAAAHAALAIKADAGLTWNDRIREAIESPPVLLGYAALLLAVPLLLTANRLAIRILGARVWQDVQRSLAPGVALATLHGIALAEEPHYFAATLAAAAVMVWLAFAKVRELRDRLRQPHPAEPAAGAQQPRFYRKRPK